MPAKQHQILDPYRVPVTFGFRCNGLPDERATTLPKEWRSAKTESSEVMQPQCIYRDARTGQPLSLELVEAARRRFNEVEAVQSQEEIKYSDSVTGQPLVTELVEAARHKELEYFASKNVWHLRPWEEAYKKTGRPPITVKWIDVNKGDDEHPNYRSRLVAREIRLPGEDPLFAPTPPLEALRTVLSLAVTDFDGVQKHDRRANSEMRTQISVIDISRAYFNAVRDPEGDPTYVALPREDPGLRATACPHVWDAGSRRRMARGIFQIPGVPWFRDGRRQRLCLQTRKKKTGHECSWRRLYDVWTKDEHRLDEGQDGTALRAH